MIAVTNKAEIVAMWLIVLNLPKFKMSHLRSLCVFQADEWLVRPARGAGDVASMF